MLIADILDYVTKKVLDQKKTPTCSAHAFFVAVSEVIQQQYNKDLEFDILKYYDEMITYRGDRKSLYIDCYFEIAKEQGYKATTGEIVKIGRWRKMYNVANHEKICYALQYHGPLIFGVDVYKGHSLNPRGDVIGPVPEGAEKKDKGHVMLLRGFDRPNRLYKLQNSWGDKSVKYIPFNVFEFITKYIFEYWNITIS